MHFDWESPNKERIEAYLTARVNGKEVEKEEVQKVLPLLQDEGATLHTCFGQAPSGAKPLINADAWLWNLFVRMDCRPECANVAIKLVLNDLCATYHRRQAYDFMKMKLQEWHTTQPDVLNIKLHRFVIMMRKRFPT